MKKISIVILGCLLLLRFLPANAAEEPLAPAGELSSDEQTSRAFEVFQGIYKLTEDQERAKVLPQIEAAYREIITKYPKSSIVHESYWRLVTIYLTEYVPPQFEKAEDLFKDFTGKYPDSPTKVLLADTLANSYHRHAQWDRLLRLLAPPVKQFIATGALARPQDMFLYSEAKFNLGDITEAEKGYRIVASLFPESKEARTSRTRLEEIGKLKTKLP